MREETRAGQIVKEMAPAAPFVLAGVLLCLGNNYNSDEGVILNGAWKMFNGQVLYRDFFSLVAPGSYLWTYASFVLLGPSYAAARIGAVTLLLCSTAATYAIARTMSGRKEPAFLAAALWMATSAVASVIVNHNALSSYIASIAVYALLRAVRTGSSALYLAAGACLGGVTLFLQTKGAALALALGVALAYGVLRRRVSWAQLGLVVAATAALPAVAVVAWTPRLLWQMLVEWPAANYVAINRVSLLPIATATALFGVAVLLLWRRRAGADRALDTMDVLLLSATQLALFASTLSRPDVHHVLWNSFPLIIVLAILLHESLPAAVGRVVLHRPAIFYKAPAALLAFVTLTLAILSVNVERAVTRALAPMRMQKIYAHPFLPGFYLELRAPDPYPYYALFERMHDARAFEENLRVLRRERPRYVLTDYAMVEKFGFHRRNPLDAYLDTAYLPTLALGSLTIWEPRAP